jgi:hypothetical protein
LLLIITLDCIGPNPGISENIYTINMAMLVS